MSEEQAQQVQQRPGDGQEPAEGRASAQLAGGTYEILRNRLQAHASELRKRLDTLNAERKDVFGAIDFQLLGSQRILTDNNCVPRDMVALGDRLLFGYNVFIGLRTETRLDDVFAVYQIGEEKIVREDLGILQDERFVKDFQNLYKYYRETRFAKFARIGPNLFMVFRVGKSPTDVKTFKWVAAPDGSLQYIDNRSDHEYRFPPQHQFEWKHVTLDMHRTGRHPHISIEDRVFVETVGGDLTIKIEDNTETGEGIYSEPVDNPDQTLDDADISYACVGNVILLRVKPYQEQQHRYYVYNEKVQEAMRIDAIAESCVLLPEDHGLIFPKGYYLQTGEKKLFELDTSDLLFEKRLAAPNGEDYLYIFFNRETGTYVLLSYNIIEQQVATPTVCHGYCFFHDGQLIYFRADSEPQKTHALQIWQTPYCDPDYKAPVQTDSFLYKVGNRELVRCMAECNELLGLLGKEERYANLYVDLAKRSGDLLDTFFWINDEKAGNLGQPLEQIRQAAQAAIEEFEKVVRARQNTARRTGEVVSAVEKLQEEISLASLDNIDTFVQLLGRLRSIRGEIISLGELRYVDEQRVEQLEETVVEATENLSGQCVQFLLRPDALDAYCQRVAQQAEQVEQQDTVVQARKLQEQVAQTGDDLEMLTEIVSNLKIEDATQTTRIIDSISLVYSELNRVRSAVKNRIQHLAGIEGKAEFASQMKLIDQSAANFLDLCDTPESCDDYLGRVMAQLESLESRFADFEEFIVRLAEKREELYNGFESRKVQLVEARNRRASALAEAGKRVLKGIANRVEQLESINEINAYFAGDMMIERIRETIRQLEQIGDTVKAEDIRSQLKAIQQDSVRQLKDRKGLYEDGENVIRLGEHRFAVNRQNLELTMLQRDGRMFYHLTGTGFFHPVSEPEIQQMQDVWNMEVLSESPEIYRSEYLAWQMLEQLKAQGDGQLEAASLAPLEELIPKVSAFMAPRYAEGYVKGVHDHDAAKILQALIGLEATVGLLRFGTQARALARVFWMLVGGEDKAVALAAQIAGIGRARRLFTAARPERPYVARLVGLIDEFVQANSELFEARWVAAAAEYLFEEIAAGGKMIASTAALDLIDSFQSHLADHQATEDFEQGLRTFADQPLLRFCISRDWLRSYLTEVEDETQAEYADEAAALLADNADNRQGVHAEITRTLEGLAGSHRKIRQGTCQLNYCHLAADLAEHNQQVAPRFQAWQQLRKSCLERFADNLRLDEFRPRVLTTFVRNKLIDRVYLPLLGDNLAKQIGTSGASKRTDRQGLLLLISPPGYGKTTLMEYIANRLGLIFMKINGPALGHQVTSLDPAEATNAAAREEVEKLNLALEMGDNVMIYVDDIQHCNPELLQKFISLCDAQRRMEGVFAGKTRTYDLRGKRVCVVMAGNPYTESGEKFRIPDMLANRADTYNIGDIVGDTYDEFVASYVENCLTSNPVLSTLANRSQDDVYAVMQLAETDSREGIEFEGNYSPDEINDFVAAMKKLYVVRDVVLKVNQQYIASAAQSDAYRNEPPFLLQGSYRNMNRIAARVLPVMNDQELWTLIHSTYQQDAQTLTSGTEANMLKFMELIGRLDEKQRARWDEIRRTYRQNRILGDSDDKLDQAVRQLGVFGGNLEAIREAIRDGVGQLAAERASEAEQGPAEQLAQAVGANFSQVGRQLDAIRQVLETAADRTDPGGSIRQDLQQAVSTVEQRLGQVVQLLSQQNDGRADALAESIQKKADTLTSVLEEQFRTMEVWLRPVARSEKGRVEYVQDLIDRFQEMIDGYSHLVEVLQANAAANDEMHTLPEKSRDQAAGRKKQDAAAERKPPKKKS
ncbi:MAG: DNA repair ATPase [Phycisphaerae bacterium]